MAAINRKVRGIPLWLIEEYLKEEGGRSIDDGLIEAGGCRARLTQLSDYRVGSLRVGQVLVEIWGEPWAMSELELVLDKKLLRAGG